MSKRALIILAAASALVALLSVFLIDRALATAVHGSGIENATAVVALRKFFDIFTGRGLVGSYVGWGQLLLGILLLVVGLILTAARRGSRLGPGLMFAGVVQLAT